MRELEREVAGLKDGVEISRADAAAARVLAGGADRDVSDMKTLLRAQTQTLNALRETQLEQQAQLDGLRSETQRGFGMVQTGMAQIIASLPLRRGGTDRPG